MYNFFKKPLDSKFRKPRIWSNNELKKFVNLIYGEFLNVSGWEDQDKEGNTYGSKYFYKSSNYHISNFKKEMRGLQGNIKNEFFLDLEKNIETNLINKFDVVFNHTTLEHIFEVNLAFKNLVNLTKDILIIVVPFLQEEHGNYGDYWRFTPQNIKRLFDKNNIRLEYINYNDSNKESIYIFAVGSKLQSSQNKISTIFGNKIKFVGKKLIGQNIIKNNFLKTLYFYLSK